MDSNVLLGLKSTTKTGRDAPSDRIAGQSLVHRIPGLHSGLGRGGSDVVPVAASASDFGFPMEATLSTLNFL
jgi:hypothetical protein